MGGKNPKLSHPKILRKQEIKVNSFLFLLYDPTEQNKIFPNMAHTVSKSHQWGGDKHRHWDLGGGNETHPQGPSHRSGPRLPGPIAAGGRDLLPC